MLNALFVLVVFMLQTEKDMIGIEWPLEQSIKYAIFYEDNEMVSKQKLLEIKAVEGLGTINFAALNWFLHVLVIEKSNFHFFLDDQLISWKHNILLTKVYS